MDVTGEPLIGVNVAVKGTTIGIITDIDGNYTLEVPSKSTIVFSYIGYQAQEVPVGNQSTINVTLKEDTQKLEEVVVVGYGTQKKVTVTGSVASVSGEELKASPTTNLSNDMVGRMRESSVSKNQMNRVAVELQYEYAVQTHWEATIPSL